MRIVNVLDLMAWFRRRFTLKGVSRGHLSIAALRRSDTRCDRVLALIDMCNVLITKTWAYSHAHFENLTEISIESDLNGEHTRQRC